MVLAGLTLACLLTLGGCQRRPAPTHEAYIWQRVWRPALGEALLQSADLSQRWRVLAGQVGPDGRLQTVAVDAAMLKAAPRPLMMVLRFDGQFPVLDDPSLAPKIIGQISALLQRWQAQGLEPTGIEIDHDCGTAKLAGYARFLAQLRQALDSRMTLSITALPAWLTSHQLDSLLAQADESVLQVHAVKQPRAGLFDAGQAQRWAMDFGRRTSRPFRVALPAYGTRVSFDAYGNLAAVDSEAPALARHDDAQELSVSPRAVAGLLRTLQNDPPPHWQGWVWFRLPTTDDQRAWGLATWRAVVQQQALAPPPATRLRPAADPGLVDVLLDNPSALDAELPISWPLPPGCSMADGVNSYQLKYTSSGPQLQRPRPGLLRPRSQLEIGWMRCAVPPPTLPSSPSTTHANS